MTWLPTKLGRTLQVRQLSASAAAASLTSAAASTSRRRFFTRYAFAVQYHGGNNTLGFTYQGPKGENCVIYNNNNISNESKLFPVADLRGYESIEGRIRRALTRLVGEDNYTNIKVSSRTDRGVHAWRNTFHVDIRSRRHTDSNSSSDSSNSSSNSASSSSSSSSSSDNGDEDGGGGGGGPMAQQRKVWCPKKLVHGLNFYLTRLPSIPDHDTNDDDDDADIVSDKENNIQVEGDANSSKLLLLLPHDSTNDDHITLSLEEEEEDDTDTSNCHHVRGSSFNYHHHHHHHHQQHRNNNIFILSSAIAPVTTTQPNPNYDPNTTTSILDSSSSSSSSTNHSNPKYLPWDVQYTATKRTYAYRILYSYDNNDDDCNNDDRNSTIITTTFSSSSANECNNKEYNKGGETTDLQQQLYTVCSSNKYYANVFEHDRVWHIHDHEKTKTTKKTHITTAINEAASKHCNNNNNNKYKGLDIDAMYQAGQYLVGTHDFTSFRSKGCQRSSPIVTLDEITINQEPYHQCYHHHVGGGGGGGEGILSAVWKQKSMQQQQQQQHLTVGEDQDLLRHNYQSTLHQSSSSSSVHLITIVISGKSFLYHQVRNIVACLVNVGKGRLKPSDVKLILEKRDRRTCSSYGIAPPQGLFLVNVEHGDFNF